MSFQFTVNGEPVEVEATGTRRLLDVIRDDLGLTGTKEGCGEGECGACSVLIDGAVVDACLVPVSQAQGASVGTVEGLADAGPARRPPAGLPRDRRRAMRHLHARHADRRRCVPGVRCGAH